jgi:hypothetical protein
VAEETGWKVSPVAVIGFTHCRHQDEQRPDWGRPAPEWIDPLFAVVAESYDANLIEPNAARCEFVSTEDAEHLCLHEIDRVWLREVLQRQRVR